MTELQKTTERLDLIIQNYKELQSLVSTRDLPEVLSIIGDVFNITWDANLHKTLSLFIQQYPEVSIHKQILKEFFNDLLEIDLVEYIVRSQNKTQQNENDWLNVDKINTGSSSPTTSQKQNNDTIAVQQQKLQDFDKHFNARVLSLNENSFEEGKEGKTTSHSKVPITKSTKSSPSSMNFNIHNIYRSLVNLLFITNDYILFINLSIALILIVLTIHQKFDLSPLLFNIFKKIFLFESSSSSKDLYWWQKLQIPFAEEQIWNFIDLIKRKEDNLLVDN